MTNIEEAVETCNALLSSATEKCLNNLQKSILHGIWQNETYEEMAERLYVSEGYIKDVAAQLWSLLSEVLGENVKKVNVRKILERKHKEKFTEYYAKAASYQSWREVMDVSRFYGRIKEFKILKKRIINDRCRLIVILGIGGIGKTALAIKLGEQITDKFDYAIWQSLRNAPPLQEILTDLLNIISNEKEANLPKDIVLKISKFIEILKQHRCLIVLDNAETIMQGARDELDNRAGYYREGYEDYGELIRQVAEVPHQSCLILTSREKPKEIPFLEKKNLPVYSLLLTGLSEKEAQKMFADESGLSGTEEQWKKLIKLYAGNPLALKIIVAYIKNFFNGNVVEILNQDKVVLPNIRELLSQQFDRLSNAEQQIMYWLAINRDPVSISELQDDLLPFQQLDVLEVLEFLERRSLIEKQDAPTRFTLQNVVMEYVTDQLIEQVCKEIDTEKIEFFKNCALIKAKVKDYVRETQSRLILKPVADRLLTIFKNRSNIETRLRKITFELKKKSSLETGYAAGNVLNLLDQLKIQIRNYDFSHLTVWQAYLQDVELHQVNFTHSDLNKSVFTQALSSIYSVAINKNGILATGDGKGEICLWQIKNGALLHPFKEKHKGCVYSVAFSPDGKILASGSDDRTIKLWQIDQEHPDQSKFLKELGTHDNLVWSVAFSPDGKILASGGDDCTIKLWQIDQEHPDQSKFLKELGTHTKRVRSVAFSPDGKILASGGDDCTIKLWQIDQEHPDQSKFLKELGTHDGWVLSVTFNQDGQILASSSHDSTIKLWQIDQEHPDQSKFLKELGTHTKRVRTIAFSQDGQILASGSFDSTIKLWQIDQEHPDQSKFLRILEGHTNQIWSLAFSPDEQFLVSGGDDQVIKFWDIDKYDITQSKCRTTIKGHTNWMLSLAFSPDGQILASGSQDKFVRLWQIDENDIDKSKCRATLEGHKGWVSSIAFNKDSAILASGSHDRTVKLWQIDKNDIDRSECQATYGQYGDWVRSVAFSQDGQILASGGDDCIIRIKNFSENKSSTKLQDDFHPDWIRSVVFSPDGTILASGGDDCIIKLWRIDQNNPDQSKFLKELGKHDKRVVSVAFSPNGKILASGGDDCIIKLWQIDEHNISQSKNFTGLKKHNDRVRSIVFSPDGTILASGGDDCTIKLWQIDQEHPDQSKFLKELGKHDGWVLSLAFSPNQNKKKILASASQDGTIKLWDLEKFQELKLLRPDRLYEGMKITGVNLTKAQKNTLKALGAVDTDSED